MPGQGSLWRSCYWRRAGSTPTRPYSKSGDGRTPLWESCQRRAGGSGEATAGDRRGSPRLGENDESEHGAAAYPETKVNCSWYLLRDENQIIIDLKGDQNVREIAYGEIMFRPFLIYNQALSSEDSPDPLVITRLDPPRS
jgi:hypothetical protein